LAAACQPAPAGAEALRTLQQETLAATAREQSTSRASDSIAQGLLASALSLVGLAALGEHLQEHRLDLLTRPRELDIRRESQLGGEEILALFKELPIDGA
jgi:hypothetical protein